MRELHGRVARRRGRAVGYRRACRHGAAYRAYARAHPGLYAAGVAAPAPDDAEHQAAAQETVDVVYAVLRAWALEGDDAVHAARAFRSAVHGFVLLEAAGGFAIPIDLDTSFERLVATLAAGLATGR